MTSSLPYKPLSISFLLHLQKINPIFLRLFYFTSSKLKMSYADKDPLAAAKQAERELNSHQAKQGYSTSDSGMDSDLRFFLNFF